MSIGVDVLDKGHVTLEAACASDLDVVNAAKVSFAKQVETVGPSEALLVKFLLSNKHGTPFEHNFFKFRVRAPIFVLREWHRHRIGVSINEESGRYVELRGDFYIPESGRTQVGKPGAYFFEPAGYWKTKLLRAASLAFARGAYAAYRGLLRVGVAKEQARIILPNSLYSEMIWSCNARSLMHFLALRNSEHAMWEIRQYAIALETVLRYQMPVTHKAFVKAGRVAP